MFICINQIHIYHKKEWEYPKPKAKHLTSKARSKSLPANRSLKGKTSRGDSRLFFFFTVKKYEGLENYKKYKRIQVKKLPGFFNFKFFSMFSLLCLVTYDCKWFFLGGCFCILCFAVVVGCGNDGGSFCGLNSGL